MSTSPLSIRAALSSCVVALIIAACGGGGADDDGGGNQPVTPPRTPTPPTVTSSPTPGPLYDASLSTSIVVAFSEAMDASSFSAANTRLVSASGTLVPVAIVVSGSTLTVTPIAPLAKDAHYTLTVAAGVKDAEGDALAADYLRSFDTAHVDFLASTGFGFTASGSVTGAQVVDLDGDGRPDVVYTVASDAAINVAKQTTANRFATASRVPVQIAGTACMPTKVQVVDLNGDGRLDLLIDTSTATGNGNCPIVAILQAADGTFATGSMLSLGVQHADFAVLHAGTDRHLVLLNSEGTTGLDSTVIMPNGTFGATVHGAITTDIASAQLRVADVDADGREDVLLSGLAIASAYSIIELRSQASDGSLAPATVLTSVGFLTSPGFSSFDIGSVVGDGRTELVSSDYATTGDHAEQVMVTQLDGSFASSFSLAPSATSPYVIDLDGDGRTDLAAIDFGSTIAVAHLRFQTVDHAIGTERLQPMPGVAFQDIVILRDMNGDGLPDVVAINRDTGLLRVLLQRM